MPKLYGNSTVLRQNRNATRFGVEPIRLTGRMDSADTGSKQHIVAPCDLFPSYMSLRRSPNRFSQS